MKKAYHLLFYNVYSFFKATNDEGWEQWKTVIFIDLLCSLLAIEGLVWWTIISKSVLSGSRLVIAIPPTIIILALNHIVFIKNENWKKYFTEFRTYSKQKKAISRLASLVLIVAIISSLFFSFYELSQIDWSLYR